MKPAKSFTGTLYETLYESSRRPLRREPWVREVGRSGAIYFQESADFDLNDIVIAPKRGWALIGETGYVDDYGWNDIPWTELGFPELSKETVVDESDFPNALASNNDYGWVTVSIEERWITYLFIRSRKLEPCNP